MERITNIWKGLDQRKRLSILLAALAIMATLIGMARLASRTDMALLYAGLDSGSAGEVLRALEQQGTVFEVRGGSIYVDATQRDALRMRLASEGLPTTGGRGYELLDGLSGFGTTSQMFNAAYWRAKEGELARTIVASPHVSQARVHIANNTSNPFQRSVQPSASVAVVPAGGPLTAEQARAIRFLVASAVAGLEIENVVVIDSNGRVIGGPEETATAGRAAEDRAQVLRDRVMRLVEARVGIGNAVVEVSVDTVTETETIRERRIDPEGRVAISTDTEERNNSSSESGGAVTVASNLPEGDAATGGGTAETSETRERVNYEVSETQREILRAPGAVRRLTVAVLVDNISQTAPDGTQQSQPRDAEELEALRELVASAVGFDESRGDVITIKSMDLPAVEPLGTPASRSLVDRLGIDVMSLAQMAVLGLVALSLGLFVIRPLLAPSKPGSDMPMALPPAETVEAAPGQDGDSLTGEVDPDDLMLSPATMQSAFDASELDFPALPELPSDPVERLRTMISERQTETVEILRSWLEDEERA